jgi:hypothetical protein
MSDRAKKIYHRALLILSGALLVGLGFYERMVRTLHCLGTFQYAFTC